MQPLLIIRSERGQMSAIERRIADFILENTHLLRDYSSQQLANALGISQSSVVKFSQKLGFKGYPDLKFSIGEAVARNGADADPAEDAATDGQQVLSEELWRAKGRAEEETRLLNPPERIDAVMDMLRGADKAFVVGTGEDGVSARAFAIRLSLLGFPAIHHYDPVLVPAEVATSQPGDLLILFSERGQQSSLYGSDAIGGVINYITLSGREAPGYSARIEGGSFGTISGAARAAGASGNFDYALTGTYYGTDGHATARGGSRDVGSDSIGASRVFASPARSPAAIHSACSARVRPT